MNYQSIEEIKESIKFPLALLSKTRGERVIYFINDPIDLTTKVAELLKLVVANMAPCRKPEDTLEAWVAAVGDGVTLADLMAPAKGSTARSRREELEFLKGQYESARGRWAIRNRFEKYAEPEQASWQAILYAARMDMIEFLKVA